MKRVEKKKNPNFVKAFLALFFVAAVLVSGCVDNVEEDDTGEEPAGPENGDGVDVGENEIDGEENGIGGEDGAGEEGDSEEEFIYGTANVEDIDIIIQESFPVQVSVSASGNFPDGCTEIDDIQTERIGNTFEVNITTRRPRDAICTQALVPFTETIPLEVRGLEAGTYTVNVNGVTGTFELETDNVIEKPFPEAGGNPSFTEADNGTTAVFEKGTVFYLKLAENPTTGYSWELETDTGLNIRSDEFIPPETPEGTDEPLVGEGGAHIWEIEAVSTGDQQLRGVYKRPWEEETGEEETFVLNIEVV